jgi:hypothetical protein
MSALTTPGSGPRDVFPALRRRNAAKPAAQLHLDDLSIQRLRISTGRFPSSSAATHESSLQSGEQSRAGYYAVLAGAVSGLPRNNRDARLALYDRAEIALTAELLKHSEISDEQVAVERLALESAIRRIESQVRRKESPAPLQAGRRRPLASFLRFIRSFGFARI